jgi:DNA-binding LacI/PurR family transcriptional regulator
MSMREDIKNELIRRLQTLPLDSKLPSDRTLAREFNVAFLTVNRVMRELEWEGYVVRRARQGTFLASRERSVANDWAPANRANGSVVMVYPNHFSFHYWRHVRYGEEYALKNQLNFLEFKLYPDSTYERVLAFARQTENLRGLLMLSIPDSLKPATLDAFDALGCPVVVLSAQLPLAGRKHLYCMNVDVQQQGREAMAALLAQGHRKLAWVQHEPEPAAATLRGMLEALRAAGLRPTDLACIGRGINAWEDSRESGYRLTHQLLDTSSATGIYYDSTAGILGAMRAFAERGKRVPEDYSLISTGDQSGDADYIVPSLSTMEWDWGEEMRQAFDIILGRAQPAHHEVTFPATLHRRGSLGPAPAQTGVPVTVGRPSEAPRPG